MCVDPGSLTLIATLASAGVGAYSAIQSGNAQYQAGMYNAQIQERNAQAVEDEKKNVQDAASIERRRLGERVRAERGQAVVNAAAQGIDPGFGSPADLIGDIEQAYDIDRSILGRNELTELGRLDKQQADYRDSAAMMRSQAKSARKGGMLSAAGSLLQGAASVSSRWISQPLSIAPVLKAPELAAPTSVVGSLPSVQMAPALRIGT